MKKIICLSLVALIPVVSHSGSARDYIDIHVMARSYPSVVHRDQLVTTKGDYWVQAQNNTGMTQSISIVYKHCTQADHPVCDMGQHSQIINPFSTWKQQFSLSQARTFPYGEYAVGDEIDVRVDATGEHFSAHDRNAISATQ